MEFNLEELTPLLISFGIRAIGALLVLIIGLRVAAWLGNLVKQQAIKRPTIDNTLGNFFGSLVRWAITAAVFIAVLQVFGVQATSFVAVLGALTLAIGLSLQGALGNIASGVMIMIFRPYSLGDYIEAAGAAGTVKDINLFQTVLSTPDNIKIMVPNSQAIDGVIKNYSGYDTRRIDFVFGVDYEANLEQAKAVIASVIAADERVLSSPETQIAVSNLGDSSVDIVARPWVKGSDYWGARFELTQKVKEALDEAGISIPYPHSVIVQRNG